MNSPQNQSLLDFLGKPAGPELGRRVYECWLKTAKILYCEDQLQTREVSTRNYRGKILVYPIWFLTIYFYDRTH